MNILKSNARRIENDIDTFLNKITESAMTFELCIKEYMNGSLDPFKVHCEEIDKLENSCDEIRRNIKITLYRDMLIPESRGDVLGLIETLDNVVDRTKKIINHFQIEKPEIWSELKGDFVELSETAVKSVLELISATRSFFKEFRYVNDHLVKVHFWEHEADIIENRIKEKIFGNNNHLDLSHRIQHRYFAEKISLLADESESVAERLEVYAIKRRI